MTTAMVAATGGHLAQLHQLRRHVVRRDEQLVWVTPDAPQSRSLLLGEQVEYVRYVSPRDWRAIAANASGARALFRRHGVTRVVSTGSGIALAYLPIARAMGLQVEYIESAARSTGPSATGKILALVPGVRLTSQYASWANERWRLGPSVFEDYSAHRAGPRQVRKVVVTLGTIAGYGFRGLVERLLEVLPPDVEVLWQTGDTDTTGLPVDAVKTMPQHDLLFAMAEADVVVAHSGVGSALGALQAGRAPVLVPRLHARGEHVDDHQELIAGELEARQLAFKKDRDRLTWHDLVEAAAWKVQVKVGDQGADQAEIPQDGRDASGDQAAGAA